MHKEAQESVGGAKSLWEGLGHSYSGHQLLPVWKSFYGVSKGPTVQERWNSRGLSHRAAKESKEQLEKHLWADSPPSHERLWKRGRKTQSKQKRNWTKKRTCGSFTEKRDLRQHAHILVHACDQNEQAVGDERCSREARARDRLGDTLPNKAANLGEVCARHHSRLHQGLARVGRGFTPPLCPSFK